jgi:hypothetical protein
MEIKFFTERNHNMQRGGKHQQGKAKRIKRTAQVRALRFLHYPSSKILI